MHKSYAIGKESGEGTKPESSNKRNHLENIIEENVESPEKKDEAGIEEDK